MKRLFIAVVVLFFVSSDVAAAAPIRVTAVPNRITSPRPPEGRTGDVERLRWSIRDRHGRTIGNALFDCRWILQNARLCNGEIRMPLGKLAVLGSSESRDFGVYSIVGGTAQYRGKSGDLTFFATSVRRLSVVVEIN